jgi:hypothetical protein
MEDWDPNFQVVRAQLEVIFDEERNAYVACITDGIDFFGLPDNVEYIETEIHFFEHRALELMEMDFSMPVPRISVERVKANEVVIMATLMMSQMSIAICPTTIHFVEVSLHLPV